MSDVHIFCTEDCMDILLLATVIVYEIRCMDLVCVFFLCLGGDLVVHFLTNRTEYGSQNETVIHGTENVSH